MLRRSGFKSKASAPAPRPKRAPDDQYASHVIERPRAVAATNLGSAPPAVRPVLKLPRQARTVQAIRDSAKGEYCLVRILGCPGDPAMTIWSHAPFKAAGKGMGIKAVDQAGAYCCTYCDAIVDGQRPLPAGVKRHEALLDWFMGHLRSLERLAQKGLL